ncbi:MAG: ABC transporter permease [Candidatus Coatesbacteria bacterium]|nr:ABC transporter permease [Candidatus Coatesbacteria bacterium]
MTRYFLFIVKLAWKNLSRRWHRTLTTAFVIGISITSFIITDSFFIGVDIEATKNLVELETGMLKIFHPSFFSEKDLKNLDYTIEDPEKISDTLKEANLNEFTFRISFFCQLGNGVNQIPIEGYGIDPDRDELVFNLKKYVQGEYFSSTDSAEAIIGHLVARDLGLKIGDMVTVMTREKGGKTISAFDAKIIGIIDSPNPKINRNTIFIPLSYLQKQLNMNKSITEVVLKIQNMEKVDYTVEILKKNTKIDKYDVKPWYVLGADFIAINKTKRAFSNVLILILLLIASLGTSNALLLSILERIRELGMIFALGVQKTQMILMIVLEGICIGVFGSTIGLIIASAINLYLVNYGLTLKMFEKLSQNNDLGYPMKMVFHGAWNPDAFIFAFCFGVFISGLFSLFPAIKASRLNVVEALHYV